MLLHSHVYGMRSRSKEVLSLIAARDAELERLGMDGARPAAGPQAGPKLPHAVRPEVARVEGIASSHEQDSRVLTVLCGGCNSTFLARDSGTVTVCGNCSRPLAIERLK